MRNRTSENLREKKSPYPPGKFVLALTGGIATGKSFAASVLSELGAAIVDTDVLSRKVVLPGAPGLAKVRAAFGEKIIRPDGTLDRSMLASIIFASEARRQELNNILHPLIRKEMVKEIRKSAEKVAVIVIPLLFEAKIPIYYDRSWLVYCPESVQFERLKKRDNLTDEETWKRIRSQIPIDEKAKMCDVIIDSSGNFEDTIQKIAVEWEKVKPTS